ncbi:bifunctional hydroxymethylpyrimidine kinase/phosphomethylpyrimidine kinase [Motiliproteus sediminis]|uniref:bifunctional hydroxymethylpyrimidine kinase/phosphomethylpyrimidine kinase n=1 Tax=Motiliproteus sediminis TaxID=1468178 RepID=UPI001AF0114D|nr:bifunctional hydroxymethylpyrimidine kinase/phosphomethylpyrimidine kinase [Motiliproteus sediminis]
MRQEPVVLVVAGSDSGAGAGLQADLKTCFALGVYAATAVTAVTVQNTRGVRRVEPMSAGLVAEQMRAVLEDFNVAAIKIGMLASAAVVESVVAVLADYPGCPVVLDPVLLSTSGAELLEPAGVAVLKQDLLPNVQLVTPNLPEIALLAGMGELQSSEEMHEAAARLRGLGVPAVLVKGGHSGGDRSDDWLFAEGLEQRFSAPRIKTGNTHGTGCTLASAIAAGLALGLPLALAVEAAKRYLTGALGAAAVRRLGSGCGPLGHDFAMNEKFI